MFRYTQLSYGFWGFNTSSPAYMGQGMSLEYYSNLQAQCSVWHGQGGGEKLFKLFLSGVVDPGFDNQSYNMLGCNPAAVSKVSDDHFSWGSRKEQYSLTNAAWCRSKCG